MIRFCGLLGNTLGDRRKRWKKSYERTVGEQQCFQEFICAIKYAGKRLDLANQASRSATKSDATCRSFFLPFYTAVGTMVLKIQFFTPGEDEPKHRGGLVSLMDGGGVAVPQPEGEEPMIRSSVAPFSI